MFRCIGAISPEFPPLFPDGCCQARDTIYLLIKYIPASAFEKELLLQLSLTSVGSPVMLTNVTLLKTTETKSFLPNKNHIVMEVFK